MSGLGRLALTALIASFAAGCADDEQRIAEFLERGENYVASGADEEAIIEFKNVLQLDPENADAHEALSLAYLRVDKPREAYWEMSETVRVDPNNVDARLRYGTISAAIGDYDLSNEQAEAVLALEPDNARGYTLRGQARENREDLEGAEADYRAAVDASPDAAAFRFLLGGFLERNKKVEEAEAVYRALLETEPSYLAASTLTRLVLRDEDRAAEADVLIADLIRIAEEAPTEAREADPNAEDQGSTTLVYNVLREEAVVGAYTLKALVQRSRDDFDGAIATLEEGVTKSEGKTQLIYQMAQFYRAEGRTEDEDRMIRRATEVAPGNADAQLFLSAYLGTQGDADGALEAARAAAEIDPTSDAARLRVAELLIDVGFRDGDEAMIQEGRSIVDVVLEERPDGPEANFVKAKIELAENDIEAAKSSLETTLQARPDWAQARFVLGSTLAASGEISRARVELEAALEAQPGLLDARKLLTSVYSTLGEHEFVIENGRTYLRDRPDDMPIRIAVGQSLIRVGRADEAYDEIASVPEEEWDAAAFFALGRIDLAYGRLEEGTRKLTRADELAPGNPQVLRTLVAIDRNEGRMDRALERIAAAIAAKPEDSELHELKGDALLAKRDVEGGRAALEKAVELEPRNVSAHISLADVEARRGDAEAVLSVLERASGAVPESAELQYRLAQAYDRLRRTSDALATYEKTIALNPEFAMAKNNLAYLLAEHGGDLDRALELAQQAKEAMPDDGNAADTLGWVLLKRGLPSAAIGYLEEATERFPENAYEIQGLVHNHLAQAYEAAEDKDKAIEASQATVDFFARLEEAASERGLTANEPGWVEEARSRIARLESASS
ncbi:MAG: tetratricopeptide repeat protein [bacterium]|nr:tetratricopeptide repeat protein [bacterium]